MIDSSLLKRAAKERGGLLGCRGLVRYNLKRQGGIPSISGL